MCEVDVFKHPIFRSNFSHLMSRRFRSSSSLCLKSHVDGIDVCNDLNVLFTGDNFIYLSKTFMSV